MSSASVATEFVPNARAGSAMGGRRSRRDLVYLLLPARALEAAGLPFTALLRAPLSVHLASLAINLMGLALPIAILQIYDRIIPKAAHETLTLLVGALIAILVLELVLKTARTRVISWSAAEFAHNIAAEGIRRYLAAPAATLPGEPAAQTVERIEAVARLGGYLGGASRQVIVDLPFALIFFAAIALIGGWLVLAPMALVVIFGVLTLRQSARLRDCVSARSQQDIETTRRWSEIFQSVRLIKSAAMEQLTLRRLEPLTARSARLSADLAEATDRGQIIGGLLGNCVTLSIVSCGALAAAAGDMSIGMIAACSMLSGRAVQPVLRLAGIWNEYQSFRVALEGVGGFFELPEPAPAPPERPAGPPSLEFRARTLAACGPAGEGKPRAVEAVTIRPGSCACLRFRSPARKDDFVQALIGQAPSSRYGLRIDDLRPLEYRAQHAEAVSLVTPDFELFGGTLQDNMTFFGRRASADQVAATVRLLGLRQDLLRMPDGIDSPTRSDSSGDLPKRVRQGTALARILAGKPGLLVLDQTFEALDPSLARCLSEIIRDLKGSTTVLIASNDHAAAQLADAAIQLD